MGKKMTAEDFAFQIIEGSGGMDDFERHEMVAWNRPERVEAAIWTMKCLINPNCKGSEEALDAIIAVRQIKMMEDD